MKIRTKRWIDLYLGQLLCFLIDLFSLFSKKNSNNGIPKKVCIMLLSEMGSIVVTPPMLEKLKKKVKPEDIYILTFKQNDEIIKIMNLLPRKNIITIRDKSLRLFVPDSIKAMLKIRSLKIDTIIDCELFTRISSLYSFLSGAENRIGFHPFTQEGLYRGNHITKKVLYNPYSHISQQFMALVDAIDSDEFPFNKCIRKTHLPEIEVLHIPEAEKNAFKKRIKKRYPGLLDRPIVVINPGGGVLPIRAWPANRYQQVTQQLIKEGYSIALTGVLEDKACTQAIASALNSPYCADMAGFTRSVYELLVLFSISELLITNDGGPGHFSSLTRTPSIIFFGPETKVLYGSLNPNAVHLQTPLSCSPCLTAYNHRNSPCNGNNVCLTSLEPETVLNQAFELLSP